MKASVPDPLLPNLTEIPGGSFVMGDIWGDGEADEQPTRPTTLAAFLLGRHAVTNSQFIHFLREAGGDAEENFFVDLHARRNPLYQDRSEFHCKAGCENLPATYVSWAGAVAYCAWLSDKMGWKVRLPSETEWQYAAMGPRRLKWSLGDEFERAKYVIGGNVPAPVETGEPTEWGLFNIVGNVFEWCSDLYSFSCSEPEPEALLPENRVIKGGAFVLNDSANFRNAKRFSCHEQSCLHSIGFRVAAAG